MILHIKCIVNYWSEMGRARSATPMDGLLVCVPICLIWDQYKAHMIDKVKEQANKLNIEIIYIPAGTDKDFQFAIIVIFKIAVFK